MSNNTIALLNTSILTAFGSYIYEEITTEQAQEIAQSRETASFIGHQGTADLLSVVLGIKVEINRAQYSQQVGDTALVLKVLGRIPEGKILQSKEEVEEIGYTFGLLKRVS